MKITATTLITRELLRLYPDLSRDCDGRSMWSRLSKGTLKSGIVVREFSGYDGEANSIIYAVVEVPSSLDKLASTNPQAFLGGLKISILDGHQFNNRPEQFKRRR